MQSDLQRGERYLAPVLPRLYDLVVERGEGCHLYTTEGDRYLDFISGVAVNALGHAHPEVVRAVQEQAAKLIHSCLVYAYYPPALDLAEALVKVAPGDLDTVFFANSGTEAVEAAIKLARAATGRPGILAFRGGFYGRSMGALSLTSSSSRYRSLYEPLVGAVYHAPYPNLYRHPYRGGPEEVEAAYFAEVEAVLAHQIAPDRLAAILIEPVLGEGGYLPAPPGFLRRLRELADRHGILLIFDEVQTGFGRTGAMFACEHSGVVPDVLVLAKAIASGMPLGAIMARRSLMEHWPTGTHGSTYGGNPVACSAALASLRVIERENLVARAAETGAYLQERLREMQGRHPLIGAVRGLGLMVGAELVDTSGAPYPEAVKKVQQYAKEGRLLLAVCGNQREVIRFMTPLNISRSDLDAGLAIFEQALARAGRELLG